MKKLVIFIFLAVTGLNVQVTGREPHVFMNPGQQDTTVRTEQHTGKAVREHKLEEQMSNDPDNRDRSIPKTVPELDSANIPER